MRVQTLQRHLERDITRIYPALTRVFPPILPVRYHTYRLHVASFVQRLNAATAPIRVFHELEVDNQTPRHELQLSGLWLRRSELPQNGSHMDIRVLWYVHPRDRRMYVFPRQWHLSRFYVFAYMMHELVHRYQHQAGKGQTEWAYRPQTEDRKQREHQAYFGQPHEIEANSFQAAFEFRIWYPTATLSTAIKSALATPVGKPLPSYLHYCEAFAGCVNHPAMRQYRRKLQQWFDVMHASSFYDSLELSPL